MPRKRVTESSNSQSADSAFSEIRTQLELLTKEWKNVEENVKTGQKYANKLLFKMDSLDEELGSLNGQFHQLCDRAEETRTEKDKTDEEYISCLQEKIQLLEEEKYVSSQIHLQETRRGLNEEDEEAAQAEQTEKQLLELAREDLQKKKEDFEALEKRLEEKRVEYDKEWEGFKDDVRRAREDKRPYVKNLQEFDNLVMSRFRGIMRFAPEVLEEEHRNAAEKTIQHLEMKKELDEEKEKLLDLDIMARDMRQNVGQKILERRALWKQFDKLQREKQELREPADKIGILLHETPKMENLLADPEELAASLRMNNGDNGLLLGGKTLHRCHKNTNVSVPLTEAERVELMSLLYDGEEESEAEKDEAEVDNKLCDIQTNIATNQNISSESESPADLVCAGSSEESDEQVNKLEDTPNVDEKPSIGQRDMAKNILGTAEGSALSSTGLISKIRSRMAGIQIRTDPITGEPVKVTGLLRHISDPRYHVDKTFLMNRSKRQ